jgi:DNA-binding transcriptional ArsR family regulator
MLAVSQPAMSKHLRVLRDTGFVSCRAAAQRRVSRIEPVSSRPSTSGSRPYPPKKV